MIRKLSLALTACLWASLAFGQAIPADSSSQRFAVFNAATGTTAGATATLPAVQGKITYICGFHVETGTATAAIPVTITVTGLAGGTFTTSANAPVTSATATAGPIVSQVFTPCLAASAPNITIVVAAGALGAGGVNQDVNAWGYQFSPN
jgi:hypothetical protein